MKTQALRYYMHDGPTAFRFELAGSLDYESAPRLDQDWRTASSAAGDRRLIVDMTFVTSVDEQGRALLRRWYREGARLIANSTLSRGLAESILGEPLPATEGDPDVSARTWLPFRSSFLVSAATVFLLVTIAFPVG
jgi:ABC-type transporter Mla MlaB component